MDEKTATQIFEKSPLAPLEPSDASSSPYLILLSGGVTGSMHALHRGRNRLGRAGDNTIQILDAGLSRYHAEIELDASGEALLTDVGSTNGTYLNARPVPRSSPVEIVVGDRLRLGPTLILRYCRPDAHEERLQRELFERAVRDPLTGLHNRSYFFDQLGRLQSRFAPRGLGIAVMMLDIDHFKATNDRHGHDAGDDVLREVAGTFRRVLRAEDLVARYGGEEFVAALPIDGFERSRLRAERIRLAIAERRVPTRNAEIDVTCSIGVAFNPPDRPARSADLVAEADAALYQAKRLGRNRVVLANVESLNRVG